MNCGHIKKTKQTPMWSEDKQPINQQTPSKETLRHVVTLKCHKLAKLNKIDVLTAHEGKGDRGIQSKGN